MLRAEKRGFFSTERAYNELLGVATKSGATVNDRTAQGVPAVVACVGVLADMVALLPCKLYRRNDDGSAVEVTNHPAARIVNTTPNQTNTAFELRQLMQSGVGFGGNGYARVYRDAYFEPVELEWLKPSDVQLEYLKAKRFTAYHINGQREPLNRSDIIHVRGLSSNGITGISPVAAMRETIGLQITQREHSASTFKNGARFGGFLRAPQNLDKDKLEATRREWDSKQAGAANAGKNPILGAGWEYVSVNGMTMADAEFLDSRKFERAEIAMWYRVPGVIIGDNEKSTSWGTGIEQINLGFLNYCLNPWLVNWEQSLSFTLLTVEEQAAGYYFSFNRRALLQVALEAQANFLKTMREIGAYSVNDVRRRVGDNPIPDAIGDNYELGFNSSGKASAPTAKTQPKEQPV